MKMLWRRSCLVYCNNTFPSFTVYVVTCWVMYHHLFFRVRVQVWSSLRVLSLAGAARTSPPIWPASGVNASTFWRILCFILTFCFPVSLSNFFLLVSVSLSLWPVLPFSKRKLRFLLSICLSLWWLSLFSFLTTDHVLLPYTNSLPDSPRLILCFLFCSSSCYPSRRYVFSYLMEIIFNSFFQPLRISSDFPLFPKSDIYRPLN